MIFLPVTPASLEQGAKILQSGGLVAFPTETVYGLGADAFNPAALAKVFEVKKRPHFDPLIIHIASIDWLEKTADLSLLESKTKKTLFMLAENFWPGPLSFVLPKNKKIPQIATAGLQTAAIRLPDNDTARKLISLSQTAVAAPSANPFGSLSPTRAQHVKDSLGEKIDMILDGGTARIGIESTVLDITGNCVKILRPGGTPKEAIEGLIGGVGFSDPQSTTADPRTAPGQLKNHYAPNTPLNVFSGEEIIQKPADASLKTAFMFFDSGTRDAWRKKQNNNPHDEIIIRVLSETGDLQEAASCLFETLHELDSGGVSHIYAQLAPQRGLGEAINDRLMRAQSKT